MKKRVCLILALAMLLTLAAVPPAMAVENPFTPENPGKLTIGVYDRSNMNTDYGTAVNNFWTRWIQEKVKADLNIDVSFVAVPRSSSDTTFTTMLAGQTAPDILFWYDETKTFEFASQGGFYDLGELIEQYGPNIKEKLGHVLTYGVVDGVQVAIPANRVSVGHVGAKIRKDLVEAAGFELKLDEDGIAFLTYEELETILTAIKEQGICEYPMAMVNESGKEAETMSPTFMAFLDQEKFTELDLATKPVEMWPGVKDGYKYLNKLYNAGLIQPDFAQYSDETQFWTWVTNGDTAYWSHSHWNQVSDTDSIGTLLRTNPDAEVVPVCITNAEGVPAMVDQYAPYGMFIMVPVYSEHAAEAVMYIDWQCQYENAEVLQYGFKDEHYKLGENGAHIMITKEENPNQTERIAVGDLVLTFNGPAKVELFEAEMINRTNSEKIQKLQGSSHKGSIVSTYKPYLLDRAIESESEYGTALNEKLGELRVKAITCAPAEFDSVYDGLINEYLGMGGTAVISEKTEAYNEMNAK